MLEDFIEHGAVVPNYELFREAYAILDGIPQERFDLEDIVSRDDTMFKGKYRSRPKCNTLACGIGWLALNPKFKKLGLHINNTGDLMFKRESIDYESASRCVFGMRPEDGKNVFAARGWSDYDRDQWGEGWKRKVPESVTDKELLLWRMRTYLKKHNQPVNIDYVPA